MIWMEYAAFTLLRTRSGWFEQRQHTGLKRQGRLLENEHLHIPGNNSGRALLGRVRRRLILRVLEDKAPGQ